MGLCHGSLREEHGHTTCRAGWESKQRFFRSGNDAVISEPTFLRRPISTTVIVLLAIAVHGPLLVMQLPANISYDANFHIFFASHYAHHWFEPWNEKWFAGFSQTTYPPLTHQLIALLSHIVGPTEAFMLVQLLAIVLLALAAYRFACLWVDVRAASYAGVIMIFAGAVSFLVYSAGQLPTTMSAALYFLALPYFYEWCRSGGVRNSSSRAPRWHGLLPPPTT